MWPMQRVSEMSASPHSSGPADEQLTRLQVQLDALRDQAVHADRLATIGLMTAGVAHEINNLLTPALAYGQLARTTDDPDRLRKAVEHATTSIEAPHAPST